MTKLLLFVVLIFVGLGAAVYWLIPPTRASEGGYSFAPAEYGDLVESINAVGRIQPKEVSAVGSVLAGKVIKIYPNADFGHQVQKDEPLLELDRALAEVQLEQAQTAVKLANANVDAARANQETAQIAYDHIKELVAKDVETKPKEYEAEHQLKAAMAMVAVAGVKVEEANNAVRQAQLNLSRLTVRAGMAGVIIDRQVVDGQLIGPTMTTALFTIASDLKEVQVNAQVAESDVGKVHEGMGVTFSAYAYSDFASFPGKVQQKRPLPNKEAAAAGAVFYSTIVDAQNRPDPFVKGSWMLLPGMTASVDIRIREHPHVWKVPSAAVTLQLDEAWQDEAARKKIRDWQMTHKDAEDWKLVWIMRDNKPCPIFVRLGGVNDRNETGIKDGQYQEVLSWDTDVKPDPSKPDSIPKLIIAAPPAHKPGLFESRVRVS